VAQALRVDNDPAFSVDQPPREAMRRAKPPSRSGAWLALALAMLSAALALFVLRSMDR
jgi:hypothetical protein